ncbi:MAG TPA: hypothetical protein VFB96_23760 [Pirellulaceae bacterium]|jgi:hypothetical protein|nr:hypothetical protein [Pirellulaceae bacterium]
MFRQWLLAALLAGLVSSIGIGQEAQPAADSKETTAAKPPLATEQFMRVRKDRRGQPLSMDTAIVSYVSADGSKPDVQVDLVGAIHVGDKAYYDELNKLFESYDVVLYELVAKEGDRIPKGGRQGKASGHPIGAMQDGLKTLLDLDHQLDCIDYTKENFVHADMSPDEFAKTMADRGESFMQMFFRLMGAGLAQQGQGGTSDAAILMALFASPAERTHRLKVEFAKQMGAMEGQMEAINGEDGSTIITERNKKAFAVLDRELKAGKKKIAVFYGAGHLPDMEERLLKDFQLKRNGQKWLTAWSLIKPEPKAKEPDSKK